MAYIKVLVGAQWGDEGKGKWCDVFSKEADIVVRFQGGNNAGHTLYIEGQKVVLHQLPSGLFHQDQILALAAGMVVNPRELVVEIKELGELARNLSPETFWISELAQVITPWHIYLDQKTEKDAINPIGTTKKGIGPAYQDKVQRTGLTFREYLDKSDFSAWLDKKCSSSEEFNAHYKNHAVEWEEFVEAAQYLHSYCAPVEWRIRNLLQSDKKILLEGAQGSLLDINHGTYPYVTSSSTIASAAATAIGFDPRLINEITGIAKAYVTRVGEGPFPTELKDSIGQALGEKGCEFGATTNRPRRCGWFDALAMCYAIEINGIDKILLNKMDILSGFDELKIGISYQHPKLGTIKEFPSNLKVLQQCKVNYITLPGWEDELAKSGNFQDLPRFAKEYVKAIETYCKRPIAFIGTGPGRKDYLVRD